jgi:hypothetical protein
MLRQMPDNLELSAKGPAGEGPIPGRSSRNVSHRPFHHYLYILWLLI